jgi:hypothetical protein
MAFIDSSSEEMQPQPRAKKSYQKPDFRFEEVFVTSALTCGKLTDSDLNCTSHLQAS